MSSFNASSAPALAGDGACPPPPGSQAPTPASVRVIELHGPGAVRSARRAVPAAGALLALETAGVCGTDHHVFAGAIPVPTPCLLGHEVIGRIVRMTTADGIVHAPGVGIGERVLVAPGVSCGTCDGCGADGRCLDRPVYGMTMPGDGLTGGFAPYMELRPGSRVFAVPEEVPAERAVFAEPMACVLSALGKAYDAGAVPPCTDALVLGFGAIGVCAATAIADCDAAVTVLEPDSARRALAHTLGFQALAAPPAGAAYGLVFDSAGTPGAFAAGMRLLASRGTLVEFGNFADLGEAPVSPSDICLRDLRVIGSGETLDEDFAPAIRLVGETPVPLERAITDVHRFDALEDPGVLFARRPIGKAMIGFA